MNKLLNFLIPRFVTEDMALIETEDGYEPVCSVLDLEPGEVPDAVVRVSSFVFLWFYFGAKQVGEVRPWGQHEH